MATRTARPAAAEPARQAPAAPPPDREPARAEAREAVNTGPIIPGRAVAYNRAGMPIQRAGAETGVDEFFIPPHLPPAGWSWEWKRESNRGETDPFYMSKLMQVGWEPVMYESYPGVFAPVYDDQGKEMKGPVRRKGLMLMERSAVLTEEAFLDEKRRADERVGTAKHQYSRLDTGGTSTVEIDDAARRMSGIRTTREVVDYPPGQRQRIE